MSMARTVWPYPPPQPVPHRVLSTTPQHCVVESPEGLRAQPGCSGSLQGREEGIKTGWVLPATRWDPLHPFAAVLTLGASVQHCDLHLLAFTISPVNAIILLQKQKGAL